MLVMSRREQEWIYIGDDVKVCVLEIRGPDVRIGIVAPKHVAVDRTEVRISKERQKRSEP